MLKAGNFRKSLKYSLIMTLIVILIVISRAEQVKKSKDKENDDLSIEYSVTNLFRFCISFFFIQA